MRRIIGLFVAGFIVMLGLAVTVQPASAASYAKGVYEPIDNGDTLEGWADVNTDCEGTFGCYTYVKMEFLPDNPLRPKLYDHAAWENISGGWATPGWNKRTAPYKGCGSYRMAVDSYNDAIGDAVLGINLGVVEFNLGNDVKRFHKSNTSSSVRVCHFA